MGCSRSASPLIFGVMRRLNLSYGPSIMIGAYLGTLLYVQLRRRPAGGRGRDGRRRGARRHLCRAALLRADEGRRRHRLDGVELRDLDAARAGRDPGAAAPHLSVSAARDRRAARARAVPGAGRSSDHARLRARAGGGRAACCSTARASGSRLRAIIGNPVAAHLVGIDVKTRRAARLRAAPRRSAASPAFWCSRSTSRSRPMFGMWATLKGLIAMMIGGLGSIPGAVARRACCSASSRRTANGISARRSAISSPICVLFAFLVLRPGGLLGRRRARRRARSQKA